MSVSRDLYLEHGWKMPKGIANSLERHPQNFTLAEWQQAKRQGIDPRWIKQCLQECWASSGNRRSFGRSLEERDFFLAKGDDLPSVEWTKKRIGERMTPAIRRHVQESRERFQKRSAKLRDYKAELTQLHREAREKLQTSQKTEWENEARERAARLPKGLRGLWHRINGKYRQVRKSNEADAIRAKSRHASALQELVEEQLQQRAVLQAQFKDLRRQQAQQLLELRKDIGRFLSFTKDLSEPGQGRGISLDLKLQR